MSLRPTPFRSFIGGIGLSVPVHLLFVFNGSNFGVSGFIHSAIAGGDEAAVGVAGLVLGGVLVGLLERTSPEVVRSSFSRIAFSGLLVGAGTKLSNGCTSGHMLCGVSRLSRRSIAATLMFFVAGAVTTLLIHGRELSSVADSDWTIGENGKPLLALKALFFIISGLLHIFPWMQRGSSVYSDSIQRSKERVALPSKRRFVSFFTGLDFAVALRLSNLTDATRVLAFLVLPFHRAFDPSLAFLAIGALPPAMVMYRTYRGSTYFGQNSETRTTKIDTRLLGGAALFGIGWGLCGICPAPGLVNFGRTIAVSSDPTQFGLWLLCVGIGGRLATF